MIKTIFTLSLLFSLLFSVSCTKKTSTEEKSPTAPATETSGFVASPMPAFDSPEFTGNFQSNDEANQPQKILKLEPQGILSGFVFHSEQPPHPTLNGQKVTFSGTWTKQGETLVLKANKEECECKTGNEIEFSAAATKAPGLQCSLKTGSASPSICTNYMYHGDSL